LWGAGVKSLPAGGLVSQHFQHKHHERPRRNVVRLAVAIRFVNGLRRAIISATRLMI